MSLFLSSLVRVRLGPRVGLGADGGGWCRVEQGRGGAGVGCAACMLLAPRKALALQSRGDWCVWLSRLFGCTRSSMEGQGTHPGVQDIPFDRSIVNIPTCKYTKARADNPGKQSGYGGQTKPIFHKKAKTVCTRSLSGLPPLIRASVSLSTFLPSLPLLPPRPPKDEY